MLSPKELGKRLRDARLEITLSQDQVAALMNVDRSSIARWENGSRPITFQALQQLAEALQIPLVELITARDAASIAVAASVWAERNDEERQSIAQVAEVLASRPELLPEVIMLTTGERAPEEAHPVLSRLSTIDIGQLTPVAALSLLDDLQQQIAGNR